jgi:hypothetical protein
MTNRPQEQPQPAPHRQPWRPRSTTHRAHTIPGRLLPALAAALALAVTSGAALTVSATGRPASSGGWSVTEQSGRHPKFVDKHGLVLPNPQLYLIYWGGAWQVAPTPTAAEVTDAVSTLMASPYLTGLTQYRGSGHGTLRASTMITSSDPPDGFTDKQVAGFVRTQLDAGTVPGPDPDNQTVYGVVMPTGITPGFATWGKHNYFERSGQRIRYAWFTNVGDLDSITGIVSHELIESATDPEGSGFRGPTGTCDDSGWCEIADVCESTWAMVDGVMVKAYWSNRDNDCIAPGRAAPKHPSKPGGAPGDPPASGVPTCVGTGQPCPGVGGSGQVGQREGG